MLPGGKKHEESKSFLQWASLYDEAGLEVRSRALHLHWMADLAYPIIKIEGNHTVQQRIDIVLDYLKSNG